MTVKSDTERLSRLEREKQQERRAIAELGTRLLGHWTPRVGIRSALGEIMAEQQQAER